MVKQKRKDIRWGRMLLIGLSVFVIGVSILLIRDYLGQGSVTGFPVLVSSAVGCPSPSPVDYYKDVAIPNVKCTQVPGSDVYNAPEKMPPDGFDELNRVVWGNFNPAVDPDAESKVDAASTEKCKTYCKKNTKCTGRLRRELVCEDIPGGHKHTKWCECVIAVSSAIYTPSVSPSCTWC